MNHKQIQVPHVFSQRRPSHFGPCLLPFVLVCLGLLVPATSWAQSLAVQGGWASEDTFRGISFFDGSPVELGVEIEGKGLFGGVFASAMTDDLGEREIDVYVGYAVRTVATEWSLTLYRYTFSGAAADFDFTELQAAWWRDDRHGAWSAHVAYGPEIYGAESSGLYFNIRRHFSLTERLSLSIEGGLQSFEDTERVFCPDPSYPDGFCAGAPSRYAHYGISLDWNHRHFEISLGWSSTDSDASVLFGPEAADDQVLLSTRFSFDFPL